MPQYIVLTATEHSRTPRYAPSAQAIREVLTNLEWPEPRAVNHWVGPAPRITRRGGESHLSADTTVTWVGQVDDSIVARNGFAATAEAIRRGAVDALGRLTSPGVFYGETPSNWASVVVSAYNPERNGPITWWTSGSGASATHTRDNFPELTLTADENPIGPSTADVTTVSLTDALDPNSAAGKAASDAMMAAAKKAAVVLVPLAVVVALVALAPSINAAVRTVAPKKNPPRGPWDDRFLRGW